MASWQIVFGGDGCKKRVCRMRGVTAKDAALLDGLCRRLNYWVDAFGKDAARNVEVILWCHLKIELDGDVLGSVALALPVRILHHFLTWW